MNKTDFENLVEAIDLLSTITEDFLYTDSKLRDIFWDDVISLTSIRDQIDPIGRKKEKKDHEKD